MIDGYDNKILKALSAGPRTADSVADGTDLERGEVLRRLYILLEDGKITHEDGAYSIKRRRDPAQDMEHHG